MKQSYHYLSMAVHAMIQKQLMERVKEIGLTSGQPKVFDYLIDHDGVQVIALNHEQIQDIVLAYGRVAALAKRAGFKMLMVHGGHGFPIEFRMSGSEFFDGGYDLQEGIRIAKMVEPYVDLLPILADTLLTWIWNDTSFDV